MGAGKMGEGVDGVGLGLHRPFGLVGFEHTSLASNAANSPNRIEMTVK